MCVRQVRQLYTPQIQAYKIFGVTENSKLRPVFRAAERETPEDLFFKIGKKNKILEDSRFEGFHSVACYKHAREMCVQQTVPVSPIYSQAFSDYVDWNFYHQRRVVLPVTLSGTIYQGYLAETGLSKICYVSSEMLINQPDSNSYFYNCNWHDIFNSNRDDILKDDLKSAETIIKKPELLPSHI